MALTRSAARSRLQSEYLDDAPAGKRWSPEALNRALYVAAVGVLEECARERVRGLRRFTSGTTTSGVLTVPKHALVTDVWANVGTARIPLRATDVPEIESATQLAITVQYIPGITEPTSDSHYLLNDPSNAALVEWPILEEWILAAAAVLCFAKEPNPRLAGAQRALEMARTQVLRAGESPDWQMNAAPTWHTYEDLFRWDYVPSTGQVRISAVPL